MDTFKKLQQLMDWNDRDLAVYKNLLEFGPSRVSTIAVRTDIDRTTTYAVLKRLIKQGVVVKSPKKDTSLFVALTPDVLTGTLEQAVIQKKQQLETLQTIVTDIRKYHNKYGTRPVTSLFEGANGIMALYELMLQSGQTHDAFLTIEKIPTSLKSYLTKDYIHHKLKQGVKSRILLEESPYAVRYQAMDEGSNRITKIIPKGTSPFETEIIIGSGADLAIIDFRQELIGVHLKSQAVRNTVKAVFDLVWGAY